MEHRISHEGIITGIDDNNVQIKILSKSACASCNIKGACNMSEMKEKIISVPRPEDKNLSVGQVVKISMGLGQANRAVIFAYVIPVIILVGMIFILNALKFDEGINALISIGSLVPYYLVLYLFRNKLKRKFEYEIH
ncbi:MAG: SoxR reducing system RseC family protein [Bacteroidales bacterium]|nr:SoxR reducing system RseC family protein [Bacteroidales bacterium]